MSEVQVFPPEIAPELITQIHEAPSHDIRYMRAMGLLYWFKWKIGPGADNTGRVAYAIAPGSSRDTGLLNVVIMMVNDAAPKHRHKSGGCFGEMIGTWIGGLNDTTDEGKPILLTPGIQLVHAGETIHQPHTRGNGFWFGWYIQPRGSDPA